MKDILLLVIFLSGILGTNLILADDYADLKAQQFKDHIDQITQWKTKYSAINSEIWLKTVSAEKIDEIIGDFKNILSHISDVEAEDGRNGTKTDVPNLWKGSSCRNPYQDIETWKEQDVLALREFVSGLETGSGVGDMQRAQPTCEPSDPLFAKHMKLIKNGLLTYSENIKRKVDHDKKIAAEQEAIEAPKRKAAEAKAEKDDLKDQVCIATEKLPIYRKQLADLKASEQKYGVKRNGEKVKAVSNIEYLEKVLESNQAIYLKKYGEPYKPTPAECKQIRNKACPPPTCG